MPDGWEIQHGLDPLVDDTSGDPDTDTLVNEDEYAWGTDPNNPDSDSDSLTDGDEVHIYGTDPMDPLSPSTDPDPIYSTYIGSSSTEYPYGTYVDSLGYIYVTGYTSSSGFPTANAYDSTHNGGNDVFILKLTADGQTLVYSTFIGGGSSDAGLALTVDDQYNVYVAGYTASTDFPVLSAYDNSKSSGYDAFVLKLQADGAALTFSTFIGGNSDERIYSMAIDESNNVYGIGSSSSSDWPVVNPFQATSGGGEDVVVIKLSNDGTTLMFSSYLGGSSSDRAHDMSLDSKNRVVLTGWTLSSNYPVANAIDGSFGGSYDVILSRVNTTSGSLDFSTYLGSSGDDRGHGIAIDPDDNIYFEGWTSSSAFPTVNAYDSSHNGGNDIFITKVAANGTTILFSTFLGGSGTDDGTIQNLRLDQYNNIYVGARVTSSNIPTVNPYDDTYSGGYDSYFFKMSSDGQQVYYASYFGGSNDEIPYSLYVTGSGLVTFVGMTASSNFPVVNPYDASYGGSSDVYVIQFENVSDYDGDGLCDNDEVTAGTNKLLWDTDSDLIPDGWEVFYGLDPTVNDSLNDPDADSLTNYDEYLLGTDIFNNDTDSDLLTDGLEVLTHSTDPLNPDTDSDSISDGLEVLTYGTSPTNWDSDTDQMPDGWEVSYGLNPLFDDSMGDNDTDWLANLDEYEHGTDPTNPDTDSDTVMDGIEVHFLGSDPLDPLSSGAQPEFSTGMGGIWIHDFTGLSRCQWI
jgi:hypothetical protein